MAKRARKSARKKEAEADTAAAPAPHKVEPLDPALGGVQRSEKVSLKQFHGGEGYVQRATGEIFGLRIVENDSLGHTHHLKNDEHYWSGTEKQFKEQFEKK